jgi:hypothetical protein
MAQPTWTTPAGSLGSYPSGIYLEIAVQATAVLPATTVQYKLLSGSLPTGLVISLDGVVSGTPTLVTTDVTSTFTVRATDNLNNIRDRTFSMSISGVAIPSFTTPDGSILNIQDSIWVDYNITYSNPDPTNPVIISIKEGVLPPGLEINDEGVIRGYATPPTVNITLSNIITSATATTAGTNIITCLSTSGFEVGRPVVFSGTVFGGIEENVTYYIKSVDNSTSFTITTTKTVLYFL